MNKNLRIHIWTHNSVIYRFGGQNCYQPTSQVYEVGSNFQLPLLLGQSKPPPPPRLARWGVKKTPQEAKLLYRCVHCEIIQKAVKDGGAVKRFFSSALLPYNSG